MFFDYIWFVEYNDSPGKYIMQNLSYLWYLPM